MRFTKILLFSVAICASLSVASLSEVKAEQPAARTAQTTVLEEGVYTVTQSRVPLLKGPGKNYGKVKTFAWDGEPQRSVYLSKGTFVEVVECQKGYAKVREHLYEDMSEGSWDEEFGWVPVGYLKRVYQCPHDNCGPDRQI